MFSLVLFSGLFTLTLGNLQYVFVNEPKTWAEAQKYCRNKYTDLATTENEQQTVQLLDAATNDSTDLAWIGLYDDLNSWKWTLENKNFFRKGEDTFRNWYNPDTYAGQNMCVYIYNGIWNTGHCLNSMYPTVCYDGRKNASASYVFIYQSKTWTEAQSYCRQYYTDLISIRNEAEYQKIRFFLGYYNNYNIWIGLYRTRSWSDQSNSSFTYWGYWQPDAAGTCTVVSFSDSGKWRDENCNYAFPFICHSVFGSSHQYHFVNESKNWTEAQRFCRENYTDLATIENMDEMNRLINTVNGTYSGSAWIGQYDYVNSWRWSLEGNDFYQEGERDFRNFYHEPDNNGGKELCVYMNYDGKWFDISCENTLRFVCYDGRENATQSYIGIYYSKSWTEARKYCTDHYTDLANVRNQTENQRILQTIGGGIWIGLYRNRIWSNNQNTSYQNWRPQISWSQAQPDNGIYQGIERGYQHCTAVSFRYSGRWTDELCMSQMPFICYRRTCTQYSCTRQYYFVSESKSWTEAQSFCRQNYTDLATVDNMEEMNKLIKTARVTYYGSAWIGLYEDINSWRWSLDSAALKGGFKNWYVQQQVNSGGKSLCVYMSYSLGIWSESSCSNAYPFVCFDGRVNASTSYVYVYQPKNWTEAQSYCRQYHTDLVSIRTEIENYRVQSLIGNYYYVAWIGLYRTRSWSDQSNSSFDNWKSGQPDNLWNSQYCTAVSFRDSGSWTDENCNYGFPFICYSVDSSSRQYHFVNESKSWTEAQKFCRQNYTDLATVDNMEEMNRLIDTVNGTYNDSAWIGLYDDVNSWRWSLENNDFYKEDERDFRYFNHQPDNLYGNELCASMYGNDGKWYDSSCENNFLFLCYDGRENATQKYIFVNTGKTWLGAQSYCREKYTDLASVRNETELQQILSFLRSSYYYYYYYYYYNIWIGLYRNRMWSDQSNSSFTYWLPQIQGDVAQPDNGANVQFQSGAQHCTATSLKYFGQWTDESCFASLPFFCYSDVYVMGMRVEVTSLENLSQSQVKEMVILQLQEELQKLGVPSNVTMHLRDYYKIKP